MTQEHPSTRAALLPFSSGLFAVFAGLAAVYASNNWCFVGLPAFLAGLVADGLVLRIIGARPLRGRARIAARVVVALCAGALTGHALNWSPADAFREAFKADPPPGVSDVRIHRHYTGGPGEHVLIIEFTADGPSMRKLLSLHPIVPDSRALAEWSGAGGGWEAAFEHLARTSPFPLARWTWRRIQPLRDMNICHLALPQPTTDRLFLLMEKGTNRCVALHVRG